jgi:hypothetical protein
MTDTDAKSADTKSGIPIDRLLGVAVAGTTAASGYIHAQLYISGYRFIHVVGVMFLLQAGVSFAVAALLLIGGPLALRVVAAGAAAGALAGFTASRTVGVFGFTERGFQPAPQALYSVLAEAATLVLLTPTLLQVARNLTSSTRRSAERGSR